MGFHGQKMTILIVSANPQVGGVLGFPNPLLHMASPHLSQIVTHVKGFLVRVVLVVCMLPCVGWANMGGWPIR